jgi:hypothetical protein
MLLFHSRSWMALHAKRADLFYVSDVVLLEDRNDLRHAESRLTHEGLLFGSSPGNPRFQVARISGATSQGFAIVPLFSLTWCSVGRSETHGGTLGFEEGLDLING